MVPSRAKQLPLLRRAALSDSGVADLDGRRADSSTASGWDLPAVMAGLTLPAVMAGLTLPYSTGPVEGANTKVEFLKRQMYGRAGFARLRQRILLA